MLNYTLLGGVYWKIGNPIKLPSGRYLQRHYSNKGSVLTYLQFDDNEQNPKQKEILILDAYFRTVTTFGAYGIDSSLKNYWPSAVDKIPYSNIPTLAHDSSGAGRGVWMQRVTPTSEYAKYNSDAYLTYKNYNEIIYDTNTAKQNCNVWLETAKDCKAVQHCRSLNINGMLADVPNINQLYRIFCDGVGIDSLDITLKDTKYQKYKLSNFMQSVCYQVLSSTECDKYSNHGLTIYSEMMCPSMKSYFYRNRNSGVIPIIELN